MRPRGRPPKHDRCVKQLVTEPLPVPLIFATIAHLCDCVLLVVQLPQQSTVVRFHFTSQALALLFARSHIPLRQPFCHTSAFTNRLSLSISMLQLHCSRRLRRFLHAVTSMHILRRPWR